MFDKEFGWFYLTFAKSLRKGDKQAFQTLMLMSVAHLFGLYTAKEFADYVDMPSQKFYAHFKSMSLYALQKLLVKFMIKQAVEILKPVLTKSSSTRSRAGISLTGDDTVIERIGKKLCNTYKWYSGRAKSVVYGQDLLGIVLTIDGVILPLNLMYCSKQGRGNTTKPDLLISMLDKIKQGFSEEGIDITAFTLTLDSWFVSKSLRDKLSKMGFKKLIIAGKGNYVFYHKGEKHKASDWKKQLTLYPPEWGINVPSNRINMRSPTFGSVTLFFFRKNSTRVYYLIDFSEKPQRGAEIWHVWKLHNAVEQFWKLLKSNFHLKSMQLQGNGLYTGLLIKILAYLMVFRMKSGKTSVLQNIRRIKRLYNLNDIIESHFHELVPCTP